MTSAQKDSITQKAFDAGASIIEKSKGIDIFSSLKKQVDSLVSEIDSYKSDLVELNRQRVAIAAAPMNKMDVLEFFELWIDSEAEAYPGLLHFEHQEVLMHQLDDPSVADERNPAIYSWNTPRFAYPLASPHHGDPYKFTGIQSMLAFVFKDQIKAGISKALDEWDWSNQGLPRQERIKELNRFDKEASKLESKIKNLTEKARKSGIQLD